MKALIGHALVLVLASGSALAIWSRDDTLKESTEGERVEVWAGSPDSVERVEFDSKSRKTTLEPRKDAGGRYYVVLTDKEEAKAPHGSPHGADPSAAPGEAKRTQSRFIGVKAAEEFVQKLAPLEALRRIGSYEAARAAEFGFDEPEGTLKVKVRGAEQALVIGAATPGGQERYARHVGTNVVYAVSGDVVQSVLSAESRLLERDLHGFPDADVTRLRVTKGTQSRELVAMTDKKGAWASPGTPAQVDETAGNWLAKVGRLRVSEYVEKPAAPLTPESQVLRIEYFGGARSLGYLELYAVPAEKGKDYYARTEHSRWYVKVLASTGEQIEQDLPSLLK